MNRFFSLLFVVLFSFSLSAQSEMEKVMLNDFSGVKVVGSINVELIQGDENIAEVIMTKGDFEELEFTYMEGIIKIQFKKNSTVFNDNNKAKIKLYYKSLSFIKAIAGSVIKSDDVIISDDLSVKCTSGAVMQLRVKVKKLTGKASSGGNMILTGDANIHIAKSSSGANYKAKDLYCNEVDAKCSSGGNLVVWANTKLTAKSSSGGNLSYKGNPEVIDIDSSIHNSIRKI